MNAVNLFLYLGESLFVAILLTASVVLLGVSVFPARFLKFLPFFSHRAVIIFKYLCIAMMKINTPAAEYISSTLLIISCEILSGILLVNSGDSDVCMNCCR